MLSTLMVDTEDDVAPVRMSRNTLMSPMIDYHSQSSEQISPTPDLSDDTAYQRQKKAVHPGQHGQN